MTSMTALKISCSFLSAASLGSDTKWRASDPLISSLWSLFSLVLVPWLAYQYLSDFGPDHGAASGAPTMKRCVQRRC
jgi:hypothetical protein